MKLLAMFMLAACLQASATGFAQKVTLREDNISLEKVFENIRKQTGFQFFYADDALKVAKAVSLSVKKEPLKNVLDLVFKDQPLTYTITADNTIVIRRKETTPQIAESAPVPAPAPDPVIRGKVTDEHDQPMVGVSVRVKGQATGTATDKEGNFAIKAPMNSVLVFSFVGYGEVERTVTGDAAIAVSMKSMETPLDAVVVVGYGTQRKRDVTGSISTVKGEDIARMPGTNPVSSLQGKVPGLTIVNSGRAGSSPTVIIRGVNSTNNTSPLYVVDGVFQTDISYLNPGDIESIEVLRDPSSIAIFGLQGGNGVIVVTTKRAAKGQTLVRFQSSVGIQTVNNKIGVTDAAGFRKLYSAQVANSLAAGIAAADIDYTNYAANTNWQNLILQNAAYTNNTLSVSTSGEKSTTLFSLGYNNQDGVMRYDNFQRYIGRVNQETRITKDIRIGGDVTAYYWTQNNPGGDLNNAIWALPIVPVKVDNNTYYSMPSVQRAQVSNPVARMEQNSHNAINRGFRAVGNVFAEVKFLQHFTFKSTFYADLGFNNSRSYTALPFRYVNLGEGLVPTDTIFNPTN
ncbi:MAG TPA: SusC/RagA family TonB-linked outer membrane protein, partial [Sediminibacterium sp.]|nr:SusC/RagA family TonB-linked outer membrane protein [Sediminibacterium sp.]